MWRAEAAVFKVASEAAGQESDQGEGERTTRIASERTTRARASPAPTIHDEPASPIDLFVSKVLKGWAFLE
jgi:hypothetical protein